MINSFCRVWVSHLNHSSSFSKLRIDLMESSKKLVSATKTWKKPLLHQGSDLKDAYTLFTDPKYNLPFYLSQHALDDFNTKKFYGPSFPRFMDEFHEKVNVVNTYKLCSAVDNITTYYITFEAYLPSQKTTQTFETKILFRCRRTTQIVIAYVKIKEEDDPIALENISYEPIDYIADSDDNDEDYGSDCEVSQLNPAFLKVISKEKSPEKSPEKGPAYRPSPQLKYMRRHTGLYKEGTPLSKEIESFKTDVDNSGGFEVGYYPLMEQAGIHGTWICKYYDITNKPLPATSLSELLHLSQLALCFYNMKEETQFENVKVLRAMTYNCGATAYNITFEASLSDKKAEIFQTNVCVSIPLPVEKIKIEFVRIKPN